MKIIDVSAEVAFQLLFWAALLASVYLLASAVARSCA